MKYKLLVPFLLIFTISACTAVDNIEPVTPTQPGSVLKEDVLSTPFPTQTVKSEPTTIEPADEETRVINVSDPMPIFLEVTQTTIMGEINGQGPSLGVGPNIYFYNPDNKVLSLNQTVVVETNTELLIGIVNILQTPNQEYTKREIIQYPSRQPAVIQFTNYDAETGTIAILYNDEQFNLSPGENRTFKQIRDSFEASTFITVISNHGQLAEIQLVSSDGSWR